MVPTVPKVTIVRINGVALREIRQAKQISLQSLADEIHVSRSYLNKIEVGSRQGATPDLFYAIVGALGIDRRAILADYPSEAVA